MYPKDLQNKFENQKSLVKIVYCTENQARLSYKFFILSIQTKKNIMTTCTPFNMNLHLLSRHGQDI